MSTGRDDEKAWAELVDTFHSEPDPDDGARRWPAAEDIAPDDGSPYDFSDPHSSDPYLAESGSDTLEAPPPGGPHDRDSHADRPADPRRPGDPRAEPTPNGGESGDSESEEEDHFVPPVPPPIPRGDRVTRWAWAGMLAPPPVLLLATLASWSPPDEFMAILVGGFIAGFVTLVLRMRGRNPHDPDNGAVV
ncbi:hypothetical protein [Phytoactinopolyspora endophytica]|uniref:hypothetical protein n=1 Tax=Phytoactinopolyspora endophytica TaxID=1642495 RepID=UPI00101C56AD|nr:hypothetical protein [Phytoactinopolyspora endophytica]